MFHKLLVAIDGSRQGSAAIAAAVDLAQRYQASLCLLHAFPHVSDLLGTPYHEQLLAARTLIGQQLLDIALNQAGDSVPVTAKLVEGPPALAILRVAQEEGCNLIIVGSRGQSQLAGLFLGSVSSAVVQRAHCPVLVIH